MSALRDCPRTRLYAFSLSFCHVIVGISIFSSMAYAVVWFEDATLDAGVEYIGSSFGASWGDLNGDGWADLWVGNHGQDPDLFLNNGNGTFSKAPLVPLSTIVDMHGAAWADFDNDGDQDLFIEVGAGSGVGSGPNQFFINTDGNLENKATEYGIDYPPGRGRTPLWLDWNADGNLDLLINNDKRPDGQAPTALFSQSANSFSDSFQTTGLTADSHSSFAQLIHLVDRSAPILLINGNPFPDRAYDLESPPFVDINSAQGVFPPSLSGVSDSAIADFDGDLLSDVFITRVATVSQLILMQGSVLARINVRDEEKGFSMSSTSDLEIAVNPPFFVSPSDIFIGLQGSHPAGLNFTLSPQDSAALGVAPHTPGLEKAIFIGYEPAASEWKFLVNGNQWFDVNIVVSTISSITDVTAIGFSDSDGALPDHLLVQAISGFVDKSIEAGFDAATTCSSVVAADFDNDMDVDLYLACPGPIQNLPNILFENTGIGVFKLVPNAGGAEGATEGRSDSVAAADYDNDGFIDLFVTNGFGSPPFHNGPSQVFRNVNNTNHWISVDLEGTLSNRDGIASRVVLTAGGTMQTREQNGGVHRFSQNHQRLHFGLGQNILIDRIDVIWPSGTEQTLRNLDADQFIRIVEQSIDNDRPTIQGIPATVATQGSEYGFMPAATDSDGDSVTFRISNKPSWAGFDTSTGELSGALGNEDVGIYREIEITADDQRGQANSLAKLPKYDIEVIDINEGPVVTSAIGKYQAVQGAPLQPLNVSGNFQDPDNDTLSFSLRGLAEGTGLGISASGIISGTPTDADADASPIDVTVSAVDPSGETAADTFTLVVEITGNSNDDATGKEPGENVDPEPVENDSEPETAAVNESGNESKSATAAGIDSSGSAFDVGFIALLLIAIWSRRKAA